MSEHQIFPPPTEQILQPTKNVVTFDKYPIFSRVKLKLMAGPLEFELNKKRLFDHCPEMPHFSFSRYNILAQYKNGKKLLFSTRNSQKHAKYIETKTFLKSKLNFPTCDFTEGDFSVEFKKTQNLPSKFFTSFFPLIIQWQT